MIALILLCELAIICICNGAHFDVPNPRAIVSEYYGNPYYENIRALGVPRNSEIVVGKNTSKEVLKLLFECSADYPVQWTYTGDGSPEILTDTNVNRGQINSIAPGDFGATLSITKLTEAHTGNYSCRGIHDRNQLVSFYLYVPGSRIFTSAGGDNITFSYSHRGDATVRIPCGVSHPDAHVTLQRSKHGYLNCPLNDSLSFSPKTGFIMRLNSYHHQDPSGTYICTASYQNTFRLIQFQLLSGRNEPFHAGSGAGLSSCHPSPCGQHAECRINQRRAICSCVSGFVGDPFVECRRASGGGSGDPCNPSPCGRYGDCVIRHGLAACTCSPGYQGKPPHCTLSNKNQPTRCQFSHECPHGEPMCVDRVCMNPCDPSRNRCGSKAECHLINRTPICSCPEGYLGDAYQECYLSEEYLPKTPLPPYTELEERLRPECQIDDECPPSLSCIHQKCQNPCPSVCGQHNRNCEVRNHRAVCNPTTLLPNCHPADFNCNLNNRNRLSAAPASPPPNHPAPGGCHRISCGPHSECHDRGGEGVCTCLPGHTGTPPDCATICLGNSACPTNKACHARKCLDPCDSHSCGINAKCLTIKHKAECQCQNGYFGDPKVRCSLVPGTLLQPLCQLRCGNGAKCQVINGKPTCKCIDPFDRECSRRVQVENQEAENCFSDQDCPTSRSCFNGKCKNPCEVFSNLCGNNQECKVVNHKSECTCKPGFPLRVNNDCFSELGSGHLNERSFDEGPTVNDGNRNSEEEGSHCEPPFCRRGDLHNEKHRCRFSGDCPSREMCVNSVCVDICAGGRACGVNAECRVVNKAPKCSCPTGFFGSPKIRCYPLYRHVKDGEGGEGGKEIILLSNPGGEDAESADLIVTNSTSLLTLATNENENTTLASTSTDKPV